MGRAIPLEINDIVETYRGAARRGGGAREAEARALAQLDQVSIKVDPEQDHELETLLEAARSQRPRHLTASAPRHHAGAY